MHLNRRNFVELTAGAGLVSILPGCKATIGKPQAHSHSRQVSIKELEKAAEAPVLQLDGLDSPLVIESIELLRKGRDYILRVRSKDGAEGIKWERFARRRPARIVRVAPSVQTPEVVEVVAGVIAIVASRPVVMQSDKSFCRAALRVDGLITG